MRYVKIALVLLLAALTFRADAEPSNIAKVKVQLAEIRTSIVDKDEKTKRIAHTEAGFALLAVSEAELRLAKLATDGSDDHMTEFDAAMINLKTAVRQFLAAAGP
ncbi:hypothetical protein [Mesorhizobium sp. Root102]|uniref:hypothetical protein n=1 Tax=Mesorhizobium sp. Root102 TaxID=1736422 RepID=UPI0009EA8F36|nr:hypothetical protein [Mesorhizobium sp. Root102]